MREQPRKELRETAEPTAPLREGETLDLIALHRAHGRLVWRTLHRLGVAEADLPDQHQEVFLVAHRRLAQFDASAKPSTWLFGITLRVAADYRRTRRRRSLDRVEPLNDALRDASPDGDPEQALARRNAARTLETILDTMDLDRRVAFTLFELEQMSCAQIAELCAVPVGTVYSRLHAARRQFAEALARVRADETRAVGAER